MTKPNARRRQQLRRQLAERDGARCFYCAHRFRHPDRDATLDHLVPVYYGGTWVRANLVLACEPCNIAKGHQAPAEFLRSRGFRPGLRHRTTALLTRPLGDLRWRRGGGAMEEGVEDSPRRHRPGPLGVALTVLPALLLLGWTTRR
ncbi:HNH endonuclease [Streptosporangium saharense]|uniref:HNH nuclease domain-containing protein n=1 Tax=Streptosporangium saharense TaxID=1706840 RepID=A0A7W7VNT3_9ACTN|nr:HNH endonuclease [Streptosporangium saharense]MBB4916963.1 hypothetical protein [Streptosporangium saharense]